ncbi:Fructose-1,6-bisphosphatase/inositol-1-monophosphatase [uncultured archaeon]|nr:Fructose-1,6-bisphosphatase/inositol-1-monophosphatase [uncultured archaeon]
MLELDVAIQLAKEAGRKIMEFYGSDVAVQLKADGTPVTPADIASSRALIRGLRDTFPYHSILSEETFQEKDGRAAKKRLDNKHLWIVDELDGTSDFEKRTGDFSVMIAYLIERQPILAVVYAPAKDKLFTATLGGGAWLTEKDVKTRLQITNPRTLENALIALSRKDMTEEQAREICAKFGAKGFRQAGSFGVKVGLIAENQVDLYVNSSPNAAEWDACAPGLVLSEAGGRMTGYDGDTITFNNPSPYLPNGAVCSTGLIHVPVLACVKSVMPFTPRKTA